ncbi:unnamed protein product [Cylicocyclus nassatus]|uniref:EGF-like domain-containing protein n=1 Tax=Cylicocyclus nassatus TaxID=53992 RepID=A0AA36M6E7_CYLNA|nr:unnamed protein product [Cylicocyclus nassatus]
MLNKLQSTLLKGVVLLALIIRSEFTILLDCDPLGTLWKTSSISHCICRPYFYGTFCHRIRRCVSGKPVPVNCTNSKKRYSQHASQRCTSAKSLIDMCECFEGYTGPLCEHFSVSSSFGHVSPPKQTQQIHISDYYISAEENMFLEQDDLQFHRSTQWIIFFIATPSHACRHGRGVDQFSNDLLLSSNTFERRTAQYTQKVLAFNFVSHSYGLMKGWMSINAFEQRRAQEPLM